MYRRVFFSFVTMKVCFMGTWTKAWGFFAGYCLLTLFRNMERHLRCKTQHVGSLFYVDIMSEIVFKRYQIWILEIKILKKLSF